MTDQELKDLVASLSVAQAKTDIQMAKTDAQMAKTSKEIRASQAKTDVQMAKTDVQMAKTEAQIADTSETLKRIGKMVGGIANNQGDIAEEFFYNSIKDKPTLAGINYDFIEKNVTRKKDSVEDEYDMLLVNGKDVAIIETKYKAHEKDLERLLNKKYANFKKLYPEYKNYAHHLNLASFYISDDLKQQALESGVSVLQRKGDVVETTMA